MEKLQRKLDKMLPVLNEKQRRLYLTSEAEMLGRGGKVIISKLANISRPTLYKGAMELEKDSIAIGIRKEGGGRKKIIETDKEILKALELLLDPVTRGDPESALRWTIKSLRTLSEELGKQNHKIGKSAVAKLLTTLGYSLQANQKKLEGNQHPDRNKQFEYINKLSEEFIAEGNPVISVDTKKKELVGNYKNKGVEYRKTKNARAVEMHDFGKDKAAPYGIYDIAQNDAFVNIGKSCDTAQFAVSSIREWWVNMGIYAYPDTKKLLINADGGGSNGYRLRLWKVELQKLANEFSLEISVSHFPPGTSKWNKIEHRLFSQISLNWRGVPLVDYETIVQLIGSVKTTKGLKVKSKLDETIYEKGIKVSNQHLNEVNIIREDFHGEWNYTIKPNM
jgi:transposase